jgi:tetratricopeptide (TPR) repeat protein
MEQTLPEIKELISFSKASGNLHEALMYCKKLIGIKKDVGSISADDFLQGAALAFSVCDYKTSLDYLYYAEAIEPKNGLIKWNIVQLFVVIKRPKEALDVAETANEILPTYSQKNEVFARIYGEMGNLEKARFYGEQALIDADKFCTGKPFSIPSSPPKPFDFNARHRNIISFSLWGNKQRYIANAIENARLSRHFYPEWTLRFYIEEVSVNTTIINQLRDLGCEVILRPKQRLVWEGLFWRMLVINDQNIDRFLQRDVDSIFSVKERLAVDEWLSSEKYFHIMRDNYMQTDLIQAGLWGGCSNVLPKLNTLLKEFHLSQAPSRMVDQQFLSKTVWPTVRQSVLIHDSNFKAFGSRDFPSLHPLPIGGYLGANADV